MKQDSGPNEKCCEAGKKTDFPICPPEFGFVNCVFLAVKGPIKGVRGIDDEGKCNILRYSHGDTREEEGDVQPESSSDGDNCR